jgi:phosphoglycolate phosphatase
MNVEATLHFDPLSLFKLNLRISRFFELTMQPIGLLIFDLDGTLVNTLEDITASVNHTLAHLGKDPISRDDVRKYVGDGIEALLIRSLGGRAERIDDAVAVYKDHHRRNLLVHSLLYPTVREALVYFEALPMAVISNKTMEFIGPLIERLGIAGYFKTIIGADSGLPLKPLGFGTEDHVRVRSFRNGP